MDENKKVHVTVTDTEGKVVLERDADIVSVICRNMDTSINTRCIFGRANRITELSVAALLEIQRDEFLEKLCEDKVVNSLAKVMNEAPMEFFLKALQETKQEMLTLEGEQNGTV